MPKKQTQSEDPVILSKRRVERFFNKLEKSPLKKLMEFQNTQEKLQAIVKFASIVGISETKLPILISSLRKHIKT